MVKCTFMSLRELKNNVNWEMTWHETWERLIWSGFVAPDRFSCQIEPKWQNERASERQHGTWTATFHVSLEKTNRLSAYTEPRKWMNGNPNYTKITSSERLTSQVHDESSQMEAKIQQDTMKSRQERGYCVSWKFLFPPKHITCS